LLVAIGFAGCAEPQPPEFVSKEYKFRVRFGGVPAAIDQPDGSIPSKLFTVSSPGGAYTVRAYNLVVEPEQAAKQQSELLDEAKRDLIRSVGGTETWGESVALGGRYAGRSFTATTAAPKAGVLRARVYLAGTRLYKVSAFGPPGFADAPAATAFLDSFTVTE
jgi:hypothetical protein